MTPPKRIIYPDIKALRDITKRVPVTPPGTGTRKEYEYTEEVSAEVIIDMDDLYRMVNRAANNKGGKCVSGALTARIIGRRRIAPSELNIKN